MTATIGCLGTHIISIRVSRLVSSFSSIRRATSSINETSINGKLDLCNYLFRPIQNRISHIHILITRNRNSEVASLIVSTFMGMTGGCLLFIPFYHPLHDFFQVPSEVTSVSLLIFFVSVVWKYDRKSNRYAKPKRLDFWSKVLMAQLIGHYLVNLGTAIFINPEDMISIGLHEKVGNCTEMVPVHTVLRTLQRRKYLCAIDYDEKYYDFHCLPDGKLPDEGSIWYTICGTPFE